MKDPVLKELFEKVRETAKKKRKKIHIWVEGTNPANLPSFLRSLASGFEKNSTQNKNLGDSLRVIGLRLEGTAAQIEGITRNAQKMGLI